MKKIKLLEMKNEKKLHGFSYYKNIANFEAFWRDKNFSKNPLFMGSAATGGSRIVLIQIVQFHYSAVKFLVPSIRFYSFLAIALKNFGTYYHTISWTLCILIYTFFELICHIE